MRRVRNLTNIFISEDFSSALLRVTGGSPAGSAPYVHASGPCGTPGAAVSVPLSFLLDQQHPYGEPGIYYFLMIYSLAFTGMLHRGANYNVFI